VPVPGRRPDAARRWKWPAFLLVVFLYAGALWIGRVDIPLTDDAGFYLGAAQVYKAWCGRAWDTLTSDGGDAFRPEVIDRYFSTNWVHPPVAKLVLGAGIAVFHDRLRWLDEIDAARTGIMAASTALAGLMFALCWPTYGPAVAVAAPLLLLVMPRFFFDSHLENLDAASAATYFLAVFCYWRSRRGARWAIAAGVASGLAMATKINGALVALPCAAHWLLADRGATGARRAGGRPGGSLLALVLMAVLGPVTAVAVWPWLWTHTRARLGDYLRFYLEHHPSLFYYRGTIYDVPFAPWHAPFVMAAITTPLAILGLALAGTAVALVRGRMADPVLAADEETGSLDALVLLHAAATIGAVALPSVPKYGGVKLFAPFFPFLAILAAVGLEALARAAAHAARGGVRARTGLWAAGLLLVVGTGASTLVRRHPYHLSYYNALVGGLPGAERHGFETQYYDLWYMDLARFLDQHYGQGVRVFFEPNNKEYLRHVEWYYRAGRLSRNVVVVPEAGMADLVVLTHEMRWPQYPALRSRLAGERVVHEIRVDGVVLLTVYDVRGTA
jgi:4-amino-4-deoxy-L-arabinose transferase-like glycosyltransferase